MSDDSLHGSGEPSSDAEDISVRMLGPFAVLVNGVSVPVRAPQERALLALLLTSPGRVFSIAEIVTGLWGDEPPARAPKTIQSYISRLRHALEDRAEIVVTRAPGYLAAVDGSAVDAVRFASLAEAGRRAMAADRPADAADLLRQAIELWQGGDALAEFDAPFADRERTRLGELRLTTVEASIGADLALGAGPELVGQLEALLAQHPLRERLWEHLITALYRSGRQADALAAYQRIRNRLVGDLGIEPSERLRALEHMVLVQDPALLALHRDAPVPPLPPQLAGLPPLFGRDDEVRWLVDGYSRSVGGQVVVRILEGEAGAGTTRLAAELAMIAHAAGATIVYARGGDAVGRLSGWIRRPAVIVADDLDEASADEIDRLRSLTGSARGSLLVVVTVHSGRLSVAKATAMARFDAERRVLGPLSDVAVEAIARGYVDDTDVAAAMAATEQVVRLPAAVHASVRRWAERRAAQVVNSAAEQLRPTRVRLAADRDRLLHRVLALRRLRQPDLSMPQAGTAEPICPYKGLSSFEVADADYFFGRDRLTAHLVTRLVGTRLLAIVGPSGVGKSSVVRAGLLPALRTGTLPGSAQWAITVRTPADGLEELAPEERGLLVIDQFEEVFSLMDPDHRDAYLDRLLEIVQGVNETTCVITLRADYYPYCANRPELAALVADNTVLVAPMDRDELREAIEGPAKRAHLTFDEGLVDVLLADVADQPGALPLLSTALLSLWEHRDGARLTMRGYVATGGVREAISSMAEAAYGRLNARQQIAARRLLLRLADRGEGGDYVRRRAPLGEVAPDGDAEARQAVDILSARRLITTSGDSVEIAHEALLREWPRLRAWLDDDEVGRRLRSHMSAAARDWLARGRDAIELYRGPRLTSALAWMDEHPDDVTGPEREYLEAGREAAEVELTRRRRSIRRLRTLVAGLATILVIALAAGSFALLQSSRADRASLIADAQTLRNLAGTDPRWDRALLYAAEAERLEPSPDSRATLIETLRRSPQAIGLLRADQRPQALAISADGRRLAVGENLGSVVIWGLSDRRRVEQIQALPSPFPAASVTLSDDGHMLGAVGYTVPPPAPTGDTSFLTVTDLAAAQPAPRTLPVPHAVAASFLPKTHTLIVRQQDGSIRLVDSDSAVIARRPVFDTPIIRDECSTPYLRLTANGRYVASGCADSPEQPAGVWDTLTGRRLWLSSAPTAAVAVNPAGDRMVVGRSDGGVDEVDLATGRTTTSVGAGLGNTYRAAWSNDGTRFVTTAGRVATVWDPTAVTPLLSLQGHAIHLSDAVFSPDGKTLYTSALDDNIFVWDLTGPRRFGQPAGQATGGKANFLERKFDAAGSLVASLVDAGIDVTDLTPQDGPGSFVISTGDAVDLSVDRAGKAIAVLSYNDQNGLTARVLDTSTRQFRSFTIKVNPNPTDDPTGSVIALSADGQVVTTIDFKNTMRRWNAHTGAPIEFTYAVQGVGPIWVAESPDGRVLAVVTLGGLEIVDAMTGRRIATISRVLTKAAVPVFSSDGRLLALGEGQGEIDIIDARSGSLMRHWSGTEGEALYAVALSPDGRFLISADVNGKVVLWDVDTAPKGSALFDFGVPGGNTVAVAFRGADEMVTVDNAGSALLWNVGTSSLVARACSIVNRNLTPDEWAVILPNRPYEQTCPSTSPP